MPALPCVSMLSYSLDTILDSQHSCKPNRSDYEKISDLSASCKAFQIQSSAPSLHPECLNRFSDGGF